MLDMDKRLELNEENLSEINRIISSRDGLLADYHNISIGNIDKIIIQNGGFRFLKNEKFVFSYFTKENITTYIQFQAPWSFYIEERINLLDVITLKEAAELWGKDSSTLRRTIPNSKILQEGIDYRRTDKVWLIRKSAMEKVYGKLDNEQ